MSTCTNSALDIGRNLIISWVEGCGDDDPLSTATTPLVYELLGFTTTKSFNETTRTVSTSNDSSGAFEDELVVGLGMEVSVSVFTAKETAGVSTHNKLRDYRRNEIIAGRQPSVWLKVTDPIEAKHIYIFCNVGDTTKSAETEGVRSGDFNFKMIATNVAANPPYQTEAIV